MTINTNTNIKTYQIIHYVSGKTKSNTDSQRLSVVSYKTITDKTNPQFGIKKKSKCASIDILSDETITNNISTLLPHIRGYLEKIQDNMFRIAIDNDSSMLDMPADMLSISSILSYLSSETDSNRLTKESVSNWFDTNITDTLTVILADKLGVSDIPTSVETDKINKLVHEFRSKISALSGGKTHYEPKICDSLIKCINIAPSDDPLKDRFISRLNAMKNANKCDIDMINLL